MNEIALSWIIKRAFPQRNTKSPHAHAHLRATPPTLMRPTNCRQSWSWKPKIKLKLKPKMKLVMCHLGEQTFNHVAFNFPKRIVWVSATPPRTVYAPPFGSAILALLVCAIKFKNGWVFSVCLSWGLRCQNRFVSLRRISGCCFDFGFWV